MSCPLIKTKLFPPQTKNIVHIMYTVNPLLKDTWNKDTWLIRTLDRVPTLLPSAARLGNRDVRLGGDVMRWCCVAVSAPGMSNVCHSFGLRPPHKFGTRDLHLLLGVSKYVSDRVRYF